MIFFLFIAAAATIALIFVASGELSRRKNFVWKYRCGFRAGELFDSAQFVNSVFRTNAGIEPENFRKSLDGAGTVVQLDYVANESTQASLLIALEAREDLSDIQVSRYRSYPGSNVIPLLPLKKALGKNQAAQEQEQAGFRKRMRRG